MRGSSITEYFALKHFTSIAFAYKRSLLQLQLKPEKNEADAVILGPYGRPYDYYVGNPNFFPEHTSSSTDAIVIRNFPGLVSSLSY